MMKTLLLNRLKKTKSVKLIMVEYISMLTSLVEKYGIYFKPRDVCLVQYILMVIVAPSLILILTVVSGIQQTSDICQVLKNLSSNLTALQKYRTERNN